MDLNTAILFFTREANEEALHKSFVHDKRNKLIATQLIAHTRKTVDKSGLPVFQTTSQIGNTFGERLSNALTEVYALGFEKVIVVEL